MALEVTIVTVDDVALLSCRGRLVAGDGAGVFREIARRELSSGKSLALDLASVTQVDAYGVGLLAALCRLALDARRPVALLDAGDRLVRLLRLTRVDTLMVRREHGHDQRWP